MSQTPHNDTPPHDPSAHGPSANGTAPEGPLDQNAVPQQVEGQEADATEPFNDIERTLVAGANGELANNDVLSQLLNAPLFFLTQEEVTEESANVTPLVLEGPDQQHVLAVFTHPARVAQQFVDVAPYAVSIPGAQAIMQAQGIGLAVNPGHPIGLVLDAENVATLQRVLSTDDEADGADSTDAGEGDHNGK